MSLKMDKSERISITTRLHPKLKREINIQAAKEQRHLSDIVEEALLAYLDTVGTVKTSN